jgi:hypothetical protein
MNFVGEFHSDSRRDIVVYPFNITKEKVRFPDSSITGKYYYLLVRNELTFIEMIKMLGVRMISMLTFLWSLSSII